MKNKSLKIKLIIICFFLVFFIVINFSIFFNILYSNKTQNTCNNNLKFNGLMKSENKKERQENTEKEKLILDDNTELLINQRIQIDLSLGKFKELDNYLLNILNKHIIDKRTSSQGKINILNFITSVRSDLATIKNINPDNYYLLKSFNNPTALASAIVYTPISVKMNIFLNLDSKMIACVKENDAEKVDLHEANLSEEELGNILTNINSLNFGTFTKVKAYDCSLYGLLYRIYIIKNNNGFYQPYKLENLDGKDNYSLTSLQVQQIFNQNMNQPEFSIDSVL